MFLFESDSLSDKTMIVGSRLKRNYMHCMYIPPHRSGLVPRLLDAVVGGPGLLHKGDHLVLGEVVVHAGLVRGPVSSALSAKYI